MRSLESPDTVSTGGPSVGHQGGTKDRILQSAVRLFAARGFDVVSVRDITEDAGVNQAAINYHFGSKEGLIKTAIGVVFAPINRARIGALDEFESDGGSSPLDIAAVVNALVVPATSSLLQTDGYARYYARFSVLAYAVRHPQVDAAIAHEHDEVARRFLKALAVALPDVDFERICWCYDFAIGAIVHILLDRDRGNRLVGLSNGQCDTSDPDKITDHLVWFIVGGMKAHLSGASGVSDGKIRRRTRNRR